MTGSGFSIVSGGQTGVDRGALDAQYRTGKSCPGNRVDMDALRLNLQRHVAPPAIPPAVRGGLPAHETEELRRALDRLEASAGAFGNARDELMEFLNHPEVIGLRELANG